MEGRPSQDALKSSLLRDIFSVGAEEAAEEVEGRGSERFISPLHRDITVWHRRLSIVGRWMDRGMLEAKLRSLEEDERRSLLCVFRRM